jgi:hypothetical protein
MGTVDDEVKEFDRVLRWLGRPRVRFGCGARLQPPRRLSRSAGTGRAAAGPPGTDSDVGTGHNGHDDQLLPSDDAQRLPGVSDMSPQTQAIVDEEVQRLVDDAHRVVTALLTGHRAQVDSLASALLAVERLDAPAADAAASVPLPASGDHARPPKNVVHAGW